MCFNLKSQKYITMDKSFSSCGSRPESKCVYFTHENHAVRRTGRGIGFRGEPQFFFVAETTEAR